MIRDIAPFAHVWKRLGRSHAIDAFIRFVESRLGASFVYDKKTIPYGRDDLVDLFEVGLKLKEMGVIKDFAPLLRRADEPPLHLWRATVNNKKEGAASGGSCVNDREALHAALAEALERYLWHEASDYFVSPKTTTIDDFAKKGNYISPNRFVGFSEYQRSVREELQLARNAKYLWIRGYSWANQGPVMIPAQVVSGWHGTFVSFKKVNEPRIIETITTGLATWETREGAVLRGALEVVERDAFMIMWLNQLSLPRINLDTLAEESGELKRLLAKCRQYRLAVEIVKLLTEAPTYAVCAVVSDETNNKPKITLGLKAGPSLVKAAKSAITEALRMRYTARHKIEKNSVPERLIGSDVRHDNRLLYWCIGNNFEKLVFLTKGEIRQPEAAIWEKDNDSEHLSRLVTWCRDKKLELASVNIGTSEKNPTTWHVEMVVMPEMQPLHQNEKNLYLGGERLKSIPRMFGYEPRSEPFADEPHPFS